MTSNKNLKGDLKKESFSKFDKRSEEAKQWRKLYKTARWLRERKHFLSHNPLCAFCLEDGFAVEAKIVDHNIPHKGDKGLFYDQKNWQALCESCHSGTKQKMEKRLDVVATGLDGWPIEPPQ